MQQGVLKSEFNRILMSNSELDINLIEEFKPLSLYKVH